MLYQPSRVTDWLRIIPLADKDLEASRIQRLVKHSRGRKALLCGQRWNEHEEKLNLA
jgi:hypothetical protein